MNIDFSKYADGLVPAIIQDQVTNKVLMLGFMNQEAVDATLSQQKVTFFSRTKNRLWTKGEESGHFLSLVSMQLDCDQDTLLVKVNPNGPVCHTGTDTCWGETNHSSSLEFLSSLEAVIANRKTAAPESSYVASLFQKGINKIAQKVGEEAVETVIEAKTIMTSFLLEKLQTCYFITLSYCKPKALAYPILSRNWRKGIRHNCLYLTIQSKHNEKNSIRFHSHCKFSNHHGSGFTYYS